MGSSRSQSVNISSAVASAYAGYVAASSAARAAVLSAASSPAAGDPITQQFAKVSVGVASAANHSSAQDISARNRMAAHAGHRQVPQVERRETATAVKNLRFSVPAFVQLTNMSGAT